MPTIPQKVLEKERTVDLNLINRGKVRNQYELGVESLLTYVSDRISVHEFVLPTTIKDKGAVLNALSCFWVNGPLAGVCETDLFAAGAQIDDYLPPSMRKDPELQKRATVIRKFVSPDVEDIARQLLEGSGYKSYMKDWTICGHKLPPGLKRGDRLPSFLYTPTTKAKEGRDVHLTTDEVIAKYGFQRERLTLQIFQVMADYARTKGILLGDMKCELWNDILIDEKGTPDCCRYYELDAWEKREPGTMPPSLDKQYVRDWAVTMGIDKLDPTNPEHLEHVAAMTVPEDIRARTTQLYRYIFWRLTGLKLEAYQRKVMGIDVSDRPIKIEVLIDRKTDINYLQDGLAYLERSNVQATVTAMSCHCNIRELIESTKRPISEMPDVFIDAAGMAAALPGIHRSLLLEAGVDRPVIGVALPGANDEEDLAAKTSIKCLPGKPVELDQQGEAYFGEIGFLQACGDAVEQEFLPRPIKKKSVEVLWRIANRS